MEKTALGLIETVGLVAAIEAADAAVKSANVILIGYELSKGGGLVTVKIEGDVGAVNAAVQAGCAAAEKLNTVYSSRVIPRPHDELKPIILSEGTVRPYKNEGDPLEISKLAGKTVEIIYTDSQEENAKAFQTEETDKKTPTCNLCNDVNCPRVKGDLKTMCIHYFDN